MKNLIIFPFNYRDKTDFLISSIKFPEKTIYIAPHTSKIQDFKLRYYKNGKSFFLPSTYTLKTLAIKLVREYSPKKVINEIEKFSIIFEILKRKKRKEEINFSPGSFTQAISEFIKDLKTSTEKRVDFERIRKEIINFPWKFEENKKNVVMAVEIAEEYQKYLDNNNLIDYEDIYREASEFIKSLGYETLIIEGIYEIPHYQRTFLKNLIKGVENVFFSINFDEEIFPDVKELIYNETFSFIENICKWKEIRFKKEEKKVDIECYNFPSQEEEIKGIIKLISEIFSRKTELRINDFILVCPSMPSYRPFIKRIFTRYNVPFEIIPGYSLNDNSSVMSLLEIFNFSETFTWESLMNILTSPFFKKFNIEKIVEFSAETREKYKGTGFFKEDFYKETDENISVLKKILKKLPSETSLKRWVDIVRETIKLTGWTPFDYEVEVKLEEILSYLSSDVKIPKEEFVNFFIKLLEIVEVEEGKGEGMKVCGVMESTGLEKKVCFIAGCTEENIPGTPHLVEIFLPDELKKKLQLSHYELKMARERLDLYRLINENEKVIFTYPSKIGEKNQMKSIFIFTLPEKTFEEEVYLEKPEEIFKFEFSWDKFREKFIEDGKLTIGVNDFETLLKCPYRFYIEKVEEITPYQVPEIEEVPEIWGNLIHQIMKEIFEKEKGKKIDNIEEIVKEFRGKIETILETSEEVKDRISFFYRNILKLRMEEIIRKFTEIVSNHTGNILIDVEFPIEIEMDNLKLKGRIDRIEEDINGKLAIIDIKTGTSSLPSYTEKDFFENYNLQIPLYIWMYQKKFCPDKEVVGSIWNFSFIQNDKVKEKVYKEEKLKYLVDIENFLAEISDKILKEKFSFQIKENPNCYLCSFRGMCPGR